MEGIRNNSTEKQERRPARPRIKIAAEAILSERLLSINDQIEFREDIYPYLLQIAGEELPPVAVAGVITLAIDRVTFGDRSGPVSQLVRMHIPPMLDAMVDDPNARNEVRKQLGLPSNPSNIL